MTSLTRREIEGALEVGAELDPFSSLPDPHHWGDLVARSDDTIDLARRRLDGGRTPLVPQVLRWPKENGGWRHMIWMDPIDQVIYRGAVGRLVSGIQSHIDPAIIASSILKAQPPRWQLEHFGRQTAERRRLADELFAQSQGLGVLDIKNFYPSVSLDRLEEVLERMSLHPKSLRFTLDWVRTLADTYDAPGIPTGHDPSRVLADGFLVDCDQALMKLGVQFIRYVDDTWLFLPTERQFEQVVDRYSETLHGLELELQPTKTKFFVGEEAVETIHNFWIEYMGSRLSQGDEGLSASLEMFDYALEDLPERKSEMRRALTALKSHSHVRPAEALKENLDLLRYAPDHWARYLNHMMKQKPTRRKIDEGWMVEMACRHWTRKDDSYKSLLMLRGLQQIRLGKLEGKDLEDLTESKGAWMAPIRAWSTHVWGQSGAYSPNRAVELLETSGDYSTRRAMAMTLQRPIREGRSRRKQAAWLERIKRADEGRDLEPTRLWLQSL